MRLTKEQQTFMDSIKVGDVLYPMDGSGMSNALHGLLFGGNASAKQSFKPIKVLDIQGRMLAVIPLSWENPSTVFNDMFVGENHSQVYGGVQWAWEGDYLNFRVIHKNAFWIDALMCGLCH